MSFLESTLKRVNELVEIGQKSQALKDLNETIEKERRRRIWSKALEEAMLLLVKLSVELRDNSFIKSALSSYRYMAQTQAPGSLERVIKDMLDMTEEKVLKSVQECGKSVLQVKDLDLELDATAATVEEQQQHHEYQEQTILIPWLKFSWENLRSVLDVLKNNPGLEQTYHLTAHRALRFCKEYERKMEFRRLCDLLRLHLLNQSKFAQLNAAQQQQQHDASIPAAVDSAFLLPFKLSNESMELHLQTRFEQLKVGTLLHLWGEAFKTIEDISQIISMGTRKPSAQLLATYYTQLSVLFLQSGFLLFHALALKAYYTLSREKNKSLTKVQIEQMANQVVLAALAIPLNSHSTSAGSKASSDQLLQKEKNRRMSLLCGFEFNPDRDTLLELILTTSLLNECSPFVKDLFVLLEGNKSVLGPHVLIQRCLPLLGAVKQNSQLEPYVHALELLILVRLMEQLGRVFSVVKLDTLHTCIANLGSKSISVLQAEAFLVRSVCAKQCKVDFVIDHALETIRFVEPILEAPSTKLCLVTLAKELKTLLKEIPSTSSSSRLVVSKEDMENDAKVFEARKQLIVARKAEIQALALFREKTKLEQEESARQERLENERLLIAKIAEEEARKKQEIANQMLVHDEVKRDLLIAGIDPQKALKELGTEFFTVQDKKRLIQEKEDRLANQALEEEKRIVMKSKKLDYFVRAVREAEIPKLQLLEQERLEAEKKAKLVAEAKRVEEAKLAKEELLRVKEELSKHFPQPVLDDFLRAMKSTMEDTNKANQQYEDQVRRDRKMEEKIQRAMTRKMEAVRAQKQEIEDSREKARLDDDARKRELKLKTETA